MYVTRRGYGSSYGPVSAPKAEPYRESEDQQVPKAEPFMFTRLFVITVTLVAGIVLLSIITA